MIESDSDVDILFTITFRLVYPDSTHERYISTTSKYRKEPLPFENKDEAFRKRAEKMLEEDGFQSISRGGFSTSYRTTKSNFENYFNTNIRSVFYDCYTGKIYDNPEDEYINSVYFETVNKITIPEKFNDDIHSIGLPKPVILF